MIAAASECLSIHQLQSVLNGDLCQSDFDSAVAHMDQCAHCQRAVEEVAQNRPKINLLDPSGDDLTVDTACQIALGRLMTESTPKKVESSLSSLEQLGPYRILGSLGQGGMGTVCLAMHERLRRHCAIKLLPRHRVDAPGWLARFDREMQTVAALEHPHVVRATDAGQQDGWHYLVMEHLDGLDAGRIGRRLGRIPISESCDIVRQAALGLDHVHRSGLVHRDIKPSNLMLTRSGTVKLLDLGLVLAGDDPLAIDDRLTTVGHLMGTMPFMAPEQLMDSRQVDSSADIYSLGATLYRMISGESPHPNQRGLARQILAITKDTPASLTERVPGIDARLESIVTTMLHRDPTQRPTALEVAEQLKPWSQKSNLPKLLQRAEKIEDNDSEPRTSMPTISPIASPSRRFSYQWLGAALAFIGIVVAGFMLSLKTEVGELIIKSEIDDVTVLIKQDSQLIERLQVVQGQDNKLTLAKGTYRIEIEGGSGNVRLSHDQVTIEAKSEFGMSLLRRNPLEERNPRITQVESDVSPSIALSLKPIATDVDYHVPPANEVENYQVVRVPSGFEVHSIDGKRVRTFVDTNQDNRIDRWCYAKDGKDVYRDLDTDGDGKADQRVYLDHENGQMRWGLDPNQDLVVDTWFTRDWDASKELALETSFPLEPDPQDFDVADFEQKLYQGKPYSHWYDILDREMDMSMLNTGMRALEVLTRKGPRRREAAEITMSIADNLGGIIIGDHTDSARFMDRFNEVFPLYFPNPGIAVVTDRLQSGNLRSRKAASWALQQYVSGVVGDVRYPENQSELVRYLRAIAHDDDPRKQQLVDLLRALGVCLNEVPSDGSLNDTLRSMCFQNAVRILEITDGALQHPDWLDSYLDDSVKKAKAAFDQDDSLEAPPTTGIVPWLLDTYTFRMAMKRHAANSHPMPTDLAAANLTHPRSSLPEQEKIAWMRDVRDSFDGGSSALCDRIQARLELILAGSYNQESWFFGGSFNGGGVYGGGFGGGGIEDPRSFLKRNLSFWIAAVEILADDTETPDKSLEMLTQFKQTTVGEFDQMIPEELVGPLDSAIEQLKKKKTETDFKQLR